MLKKISFHNFCPIQRNEGELKGTAILLFLSNTEFCVVYGEFLKMISNPLPLNSFPLYVS